MIRNRSLKGYPLCGRCCDIPGELLEGAGFAILLIKAGVMTFDFDHVQNKTSVLEDSFSAAKLTAGARALDGDALDSMIGELARGEMSPERLRAIIERDAPN
tara:strand:+ start:1601 stop:1906 length:306 start_codon:yes stop_codon:yes gene_type:complete